MKVRRREDTEASTIFVWSFVAMTYISEATRNEDANHDRWLTLVNEFLIVHSRPFRNQTQKRRIQKEEEDQ